MDVYNFDLQITKGIKLIEDWHAKANVVQLLPSGAALQRAPAVSWVKFTDEFSIHIESASKPNNRPGNISNASSLF